MQTLTYPKASKYTDLETIYAQCSGPGGLKLAEFIADKMRLQANKRLRDVGTNRGYQSCFLAKEYGVSVVGIDPCYDREDNRAHIEHLMHNARTWGVGELVLGVQVGLPNTKFANKSFDYAYSTTTLEMIRGISGEAAFRQSLAEIYRVIVPGGIFGLGEPMHFDVDIPGDLAPLVTQGDEPWADYFVTIQESVSVIKSVGFEIIQADYAPDARLWWEEFAQYDPFCRIEPDGEPRIIRVDGGRWLSFGYVIAQKPR